MENSKELLVEQLLTDHYDTYYRLAFSYVHNEADAMDIVQEGAYKAILKCESLKETDFAGTWIYRIMLNEIYSTLRQKNRAEEKMSALETLQDVPAGETEDRLPLREALEMLSPREKALIELRFFEDMKIEDIARVLDENVSTVKSRLYRTLQKLKLSLEE